MDHKNNHAGGGFLFGLLVGIALTLLFTTKKGRKILKTLTDEGLDRMSSLEDLFEKKIIEEDMDDDSEGGQEYIPTKKSASVASPMVSIPPTEAEMHESLATSGTSDQEQSFISPVSPDDISSTSTGRRFFRGVPKRSI